MAFQHKQTIHLHHPTNFQKNTVGFAVFQNRYLLWEWGERVEIDTLGKEKGGGGEENRRQTFNINKVKTNIKWILEWLDFWIP